ncbi:unnamed protein product, partial [Prorocentrum cordatum]
PHQPCSAHAEGGTRLVTPGSARDGMCTDPGPKTGPGWDECRFMIAALRTSDRPRHSLSATAARDSGKMPTRGVQHTLPCRKLCRLMALSSKT